MKPVQIFLIFALMATASAAPLPLGGSANVPLADEIAGDGAGGWTDQGAENSLTGFPTGEVTFEGIPFVIPVEGNNAAVAFQNAHRPGMPAQVTISAGGAKGKFLYLLTSCAFEFSRGQEVASVTIRYADGTSQVEPLVYERQTGAWWMPSTPEAGVVAWRGKNALDVPVGAYLSWIKLSDAPVEAVDMRSANTKGMFFLLGLSISDITGIQVPPLWLPETLPTKSWLPVEMLRDNGCPSVWEGHSSTTDRQLVAELDLSVKALSSEDATRLARIVRLLGYNTVRLPSLETFLPPVGAAVTSGADPEASASLRRILDALKSENMKVSLTLGGGRKYGIDDGVAAYRQINNRLANQCFVDAEATRLLLDSARAASEVQPISVSLLSSNILLGDYESLFTPPHRNMLQNAWRTWLQERYPSNEALAAAWQVPGSPPPLNPREALARTEIDLLSIHDFSAFQLRFRKRFADQMQFLGELQAGWFMKVVPEVRKVFPSSMIFSPGWMVTDKLGDFQTRAAGPLDGIEERVGDTYVGTGTEGAAYFFNRSAFLAPDRWSYRPAFNRIAGKPFMIAENAAAWPGDYEFARLLLTMVFGGLQGWDGILHRGISTLTPTPPMALPPHSSNSLQNPSFLAILPLGRHLFLRGDLERAPLTFSRALESPATFREHGPTPFPPALQNLLFVGGVESTLSGSATARTNSGTGPVLKSATGQVECDMGNDLLKISTPASLAIAGKDGGLIAGESVSLESSCGYGVVYATALDGRPLAASRSIILGAVGRTRNSGQAVEISNGPLGVHERLWRIREPGTAPVLMEPAKGVFTMHGVPPGKWRLQPLNLLGQPNDAKPKLISPKDGTLRVGFDTNPLFLLSHEAK